MALDKKEKRALSKFRLEKAGNLLEDAKLLLKEGRADLRSIEVIMQL